MKKIAMETFKNPPPKYRGTPFFAWNSEIDSKVIEERLDDYEEMGMGGCCIHSRIGLNTEYLGEKFMELVSLCVGKNKARGMSTLLYDEDKWPSGYGGGRAVREEKYRNRYLLFSPFAYEDGIFHRGKTPETRLVLDGVIQRFAIYEVIQEDGYLVSYQRLKEKPKSNESIWYAYLVITGSSPWFNNQSYLDTLNSEAVEQFIKASYEPYAEILQTEFSKSIPSIFTDEPQFSLKENFKISDGKEEVGIPYTDDFEETFKMTYGRSFLDHLPELFWEMEKQMDYRIRFQYHDHIAERFCKAYMDTIYKWCENHNISLTGHVMNEPTLDSQSRAIGEAMRTYRAFQIPGVDILAWRLEYNTVKQAQSAIHQYGRPELTSEMYGVMNWDFDFCGHKGMGDWQTALGVTNRVHHLSWYSMNGEAKRDYPAPLDRHSPWYSQYGHIETYFARIRIAMEHGKPLVRIGILHPIESYWMSLGPEDLTGQIRKEMDEQFATLTEWLLFGSLDFDFISESSISSLYKGSSDGRFQFGAMEYDVILIPPLRTIRSTTLRMLEEFQRHNGKIIFTGLFPDFVDGQQDDKAKVFGKNTTQIPFARQSILKILEPYREVKILEKDGTQCMEYFYRLRESDGEKWLFLAKGRPERERGIPKEKLLIVVLKGRYQCTFPDPRSGEYIDLPWKAVGDETRISWECFEHDSLLVRLVRLEEDMEMIPHKIKKEIVYGRRYQKSVEYILEEPNVLLLDQPMYSLNGEEWKGPEEVLRIDDQVRRQLGYGLRTESFPQPWIDSEVEGKYHLIRLKFTVVSEVGNIPISAAIEGNPCRIVWNGQEVGKKKSGWYVDRCFPTWEIGMLKKGRNELLIELPFGRKTNLEWCYLLGEFGTKVFGNQVVLTEKPKELYFGDITTQGLAFYGGNLSYVMELDLPEGDLEVVVPHYKAPLLEVILDGKISVPIIEAPYRAKMGKIAEGRHKIQIISYGNRFNTFGQLHNCDPKEVYFGPQTWRTKKDAWCYEYRLRPTGILCAPQIYVKR